MKVQRAKNNDHSKHLFFTVVAVGIVIPDMTNLILLQKNVSIISPSLQLMISVYHLIVREMSFQGCACWVFVAKYRKVSKRGRSEEPPPPTWAFIRCVDLNLFRLQTTLISPFSISQHLPHWQDVVLWAAAIIGCLVPTLGVVRSLTLPALIQSDSDRHIKMQIPARALLAILSLPFSLCGMLRGKELRALALGLHIQMATWFPNRAAPARFPFT